jgi:fluoroquinolone transport system permease protein
MPYSVPLSRAVWPALVSGTGGLAVGALFALLPGDGLPIILGHSLVLVTAAGGAYVLDDAARHLTDVVPATLLRRRLARAGSALLVTGTAWALLLLLVRWRWEQVPIDRLTWELAAVELLMVSAAAVVARSGELEPGNVVAAGTALALLALFVSQPVLHLRLLVTTAEDPTRAGVWAALMALSTATFLFASRDPASVNHLRAGGRGPLTPTGPHPGQPGSGVPGLPADAAGPTGQRADRLVN